MSLKYNEGPSLIIPSLVIHFTSGVGRPEAVHRNSSFVPSCTSFSGENVVSRMIGGSEKCLGNSVRARLKIRNFQLRGRYQM
jgi:hypothetical protein